MTQLIIDTDLPHALTALLGIHKALGNMEGVLDGIGQTLQDSTRDRLATGKKAPDGTPWARLAPATLAKKGSDILMDTGQLHQSIAYHVAGDTLFVGTSKTYGQYHQFGTSTLPKREFLGLSDDDKTQLQRRLNEWLTQLLEQNL